MEEKPVKDPLSIEHANSIAFVAEYDDGSEDYFRVDRHALRQGAGDHIARIVARWCSNRAPGLDLRGSRGHEFPAPPIAQSRSPWHRPWHRRRQYPKRLATGGS